MPVWGMSDVSVAGLLVGVGMAAMAAGAGDDIFVYALSVLGDGRVSVAAVRRVAHGVQAPAAAPARMPARTSAAARMCVAAPRPKCPGAMWRDMRTSRAAGISVVLVWYALIRFARWADAFAMPCCRCREMKKPYRAEAWTVRADIKAMPAMSAGISMRSRFFFIRLFRCEYVSVAACGGIGKRHAEVVAAGRSGTP